MALTQIADVIVPQVFTPYTQQMTEEKTRMIQAGVLVRDAFMDDLLAGGGLTFQVPSWKDLANDADNVSTDQGVGVNDAVPAKIGTSQETAVRLSRNQSWSSADLTSALAGSDPQSAIAGRVSDYWARRLQAAFVATMKGVFADNDAAPAGTEHVQGDLTVDISAGGVFTDGVTNFSAEAFIDAITTLGDSAPDVTLIMVHSLVYARMQKNNLIDFIPDSQANIGFGTFLGKSVIVDDGVPFSGSVFETWIFGPGALRLGVGSARVPTEVDRFPQAGLGGGQEVLFNRVEWSIHPVGHKYAGTAPSGGPSNAATANNLAHVDSWVRVFPERKQIKIARLKTTES